MTRAASAGERELEDASSVHDRDLVPEAQGLRHVVGHEHHRLAEARLQVAELVLERAARQGIERAERLVHQEHGRIGGEGAGEPHALTLPARELPGRLALVARRLEADEREQLARARASLLLAPAEETGHEGDVLAHAQVGEEADLLDDPPDAAAELDRVPLPHVAAEHDDALRSPDARGR